MKEYIVSFTDDAYIERFDMIYGTSGELIRCKECKHRVPDENGNARICNHPNNNAWNISDMHYCGYAKRRGEQ